MPLLQENQGRDLETSFEDDATQKQGRQMLIALTLLLAALIVVLTKDREFWFPSTPALQSGSEPFEEASPELNSQPEEAITTARPAVPAYPKANPHTVQPTAVAAARPGTGAAPVVTSRTVLPPLDVEVVTGDEHRAVPAGTNAVKVDLQTRTAVGTAKSLSNSRGVADGTTRVHLSPDTQETVSRPVKPNYPLLAKQMKIQGAVILQALIGREGNIEELHILSGPAILSAAAREAVKQWRFRPYLQFGQAVETEARITVNFTIWTQ